MRFFILSVMTNLDDKDNDIDYFNLGLVVDSIPAEGIEGMEGIEADLLNYNDIDNEIDQGEPEAEYFDTSIGNLSRLNLI